MNFSAQAEQLLLDWGNALIQLQLAQPRFPTLDGGILCPACAGLHGRSTEMVYPLLRLVKMTGEDHFFDAAIRLQNWWRSTEVPDGEFHQPQANNTTNALSEAIALAQSLLFHENLLDFATRKIWRKDLQKNVLGLFDKIAADQPNPNDLAPAAAVFALAGRVFDEPRFTRKARELARACPNRLTPLQNFLPNQVIKPSAKGFFPVDLAETVSVALPGLALYFHLTQDSDILQPLLNLMKTHLHFLLPDGGWDDSWGNRLEDWTYWGQAGRGSSLVACLLLATENAAFSRFASQQLALLRKATHHGFLFPGLHANPEKAPCILSLSSQANSLATILDYGLAPQNPAPDFPGTSVDEFPEIRTWKVHSHPWHATLTTADSDKIFTAGGVLSLVWHARAGLLISTSPVPPDCEHPGLNTRWLLPRLEFVLEGTVYRQIHDRNVQINKAATNPDVEFVVYAKLLSPTQQDPPFGEASRKIHYRFSSGRFTISINVGRTIPLPTIRFWLPVVSSGEKITPVTPKIIEIEKPTGRLQISGNVPLIIPAQSIFRPFPGLEALPLAIDWPIKQIETLEVTFSFSETSQLQENG